jgi:imidazole glycerol-phosphate synthase subunit HisH
LPGVGSFGEGMKNLKEKGLDKAIVAYAKAGNPLLGICLGMQLLMSESHEFGYHKGLDLIGGEVLPFPDNVKLMEEGYKIPHVGWNSIYGSQGWRGTILGAVDKEMDAYFVHSLYVKPRENDNALALTNYFGHRFCSAVKEGNIYGCQFHPEKSGHMGLAILGSFISS